MCDNAQLHVTRKCKLKFAITANFIDEVELDVVPLDICGIVLGSPYLYDRKVIFHRHENKYHLFKDGLEYIMRAHSKKLNLSLVNVGQMKILVNWLMYLTNMMRCFKNQRDYLQREESNMRYSCNKIVLFLTLACTGF